jgi:hypothetical protein
MVQEPLLQHLSLSERAGRNRPTFNLAKQTARLTSVRSPSMKTLTAGTLAFIEMHTERVLQPTLPLW